MFEILKYISLGHQRPSTPIKAPRKSAHPRCHLGHSTGSRCGAASLGLGNSLTICSTVSAKGSHLKQLVLGG